MLRSIASLALMRRAVCMLVKRINDFDNHTHDHADVMDARDHFRSVHSAGSAG